DGSGTVLFTGYCEPIVPGSKVRTERFRYPLYKAPPDLVRTADGVPLGRRTPDRGIVLYFTREEIDQGGALAGKGLELAWVAHPFDAYVIHVQGSGRISPPDGKEMKIGYAGKTDRPYVSVAESLVRDGKIRRADLSLTAVRDYFHRNPNDLGRYLVRNPS